MNLIDSCQAAGPRSSASSLPTEPSGAPRRALVSALALLGAVAGCANTPPANPGEQSVLQVNPCPSGLPADTRCFTGQDSAGAHLWVAMPEKWSGLLVVHAHGGPELGAPVSSRGAQDLQRWAVMLRAGHAWAGTTFAQGGVAVRAAAQDTERLRQIVVRELGQPRFTLLHGQSWGAGVAAITAEMFPQRYNAVLLTSGVLGGGTRSYDFRLDLRVIYQALCHNHPKADEPAYPLWQGLPLNQHLTRSELTRRVNACTGLDRPAAQRSPEQSRILATLLAQARIPESSLLGHLAWATWHFQDIAFHQLDGGNAFGNQSVRYISPEGGPESGPDLNTVVARYRADSSALARFSADTDPTGHIGVPVLSLRGIRDATAFVELDSIFRETMARAGQADKLLQIYSDEASHSYLNDAEYLAAVEAVQHWAETGLRPQPHDILLRCQALLGQTQGKCNLKPDYRVAALETRVPARER